MADIDGSVADGLIESVADSPTEPLTISGDVTDTSVGTVITNVALNKFNVGLDTP